MSFLAIFWWGVCLWIWYCSLTNRHLFTGKKR